jgi:deoxycytidylate deaminase
MDNYRICTDWYFLKMANLVSVNVLLVHVRKVGCVIVNSKKHVVATGYNGVASRSRTLYR